MRFPVLPLQLRFLVFFVFLLGLLQTAGVWTQGVRFVKLGRLNVLSSHSSMLALPRIVVRTLSIKLLRVLCLQIGVRLCAITRMPQALDPRLQTRSQRSAQVLCYLETGLFALTAIAKPKTHKASCNRLCSAHTHMQI